LHFVSLHTLVIDTYRPVDFGDWLRYTMY